MKREQQDAGSEGDGSWKNKVDYSQPVLGSRHKHWPMQHGPSKGSCGQEVSQRFSMRSMSGVGKQRALLSWLHQIVVFILDSPHGLCKAGGGRLPCN